MKKYSKFISLVIVVLLIVAMPITSVCFFNLKNNKENSKFDIYKTASATYISGSIASDVDDINDVFGALENIKHKFGISDVKNELYYHQTINLVYGKTYQFKQLYKGFFVHGKSLSVTVDRKGEILSVVGNVGKINGLNIDAKLLEPNLKDVLVDFAPYTIQSTEMVVYEKESKAYFCYNLTLYSNSLYSVFIDAYTGDLIECLPLEDSLTTLPTSGYTITQEEVDQKDAFNNNVSVNMEKYVSNSDSDTFYLLADSSKNIYMADIQNKEAYSGYEYYISEDGKIEDSVAITAYVNLITSYDFYDQYLDVQGISDGNGKLIKLIALVHYGKDYNNAAYVYTTSGTTHYFIFGDGTTEDGYNSFAKGLDVVGHEYTHAMTRSVVDLKYLNESGALSEAYSDIFGAMIEATKYNYTFTDGKFWAIGEDLFVDANKCIRNLKDPDIKNYANKVADCNLAHNHDAYKCDRGGVHSNCEIFTYAIYKMSEMNVFSDINSMATLLYSSLSYLTTTATLADAREALLLASEHLELGQEMETAIMNSFAAVGIGSESRTYSFYADESLTGTPITISAEIGDSVTVPACTFENNNKFFWYWTNSDGEILEAGKTLTMGSQNKSFYAVWSENELSVLDGKGNSLSPYKINDFMDLKTLAYYVNQSAFNGMYNTARYEVTSDIEMTSELWEPIGNEDNPFEGTFNGGKFKIKNINLNAESSRKYNGLFGYLGSGAYIYDVVIEETTINTQATYTGSIAGFSNGTIVTSINHANIYSEGTAGGLVGIAKTNESTMIENCYNTGTISANYAGGLVGQAYSSLFENTTLGLEVYLAGYIVNSYNNGEVLGDIVGGICGRANGVYFVNCINNGDLSADETAGGVCGILTMQDMINAPLVEPNVNIYAGIFSARNSAEVDAIIKGGLVGQVLCINTNGAIYIEKCITTTGLDLFGNSFDSNTTTVVRQKLNSQTADNAFSGKFDYDNLEYYLTDEWTIIHGFTPYDFTFTWSITENAMPEFTDVEFWINYAHYFTGYGYEFYGYGSKDMPYEISTAEQLAGLSALVAGGEDFAGKYFKLTADIDLSGKAWIGIGMMYNAATDVNHGFAGNFDGNGYVIENLTGTTVGSIVEDEDYTSGYRTLIYFGSLFGMTTPAVKTEGGQIIKYFPTIKNMREELLD